MMISGFRSDLLTVFSASHPRCCGGKTKSKRLIRAASSQFSFGVVGNQLDLCWSSSFLWCRGPPIQGRLKPKLGNPCLRHPGNCHRAVSAGPGVLHLQHSAAHHFGAFQFPVAWEHTIYRLSVRGHWAMEPINTSYRRSCGEGPVGRRAVEDEDEDDSDHKSNRRLIFSWRCMYHDYVMYIYIIIYIHTYIPERIGICLICWNNSKICQWHIITNRETRGGWSLWQVDEVHWCSLCHFLVSFFSPWCNRNGYSSGLCELSATNSAKR